MKTKWFRLISLMVVLAFACAAVMPAAAQPALKPGGGNSADRVKESSNGVYIIQMLEEPVVAYDGSIPGLKATQPDLGEKIDPYSTDVTKYAAYLTDKHEKALKKVGGTKLYDYVYSFNGFAAQLSLEQATKLATSDGVLMVSPDELHTVNTSSTPSFLGLDAEGGLWEMLGGIGKGGEDVIIGIVDSGIWPESLSFSDRVDANGVPSAKGKKVYQQIPGWHGKCVPGEGWNASYCNQKLIGAQYFNAAWEPGGGIDVLLPWEFNSPRDYNGHGTHTSSTAGGNYGVPTTGPAAAFGSISGMAPRARIAMYKALWSLEDGSQASGYTSDLVAAIDQAVADGVDVINYSISGTLTNFLDPAQVAFLYAARAGVFVSASAGNSGPTTSTVAHPGPWLTTVAAGTHNRNGEGSVTLGNGVTYYGASVATAVGPAPLVDSVDVGLAGASPTEVELCYIGTLDPAKVAGKIVLCKRGVIARVDKSRAVQMAGGVGMIMYNSPDSSLNADFHFVPTVHVNKNDGLAIKAYIAAMGAGATATINAATIVYNTPAPYTASFSSRGPLRAGDGDLLKPDLMAPGQDILAAVAPPGNAGRNFNLYSGTSMSAPHVAGVAALLKDLHPDWSPMAIKSALMTSAYDILDGPTSATVIFRMGAGHINPNAAADPGLIYDSGWNDWLAFLCGTTTGVSPATCDLLEMYGYSTEPSNLNVPSIAIGALAGTQTVTRTVENLFGATSTYEVSIEGMDGIDVVVEPATLTLNPGEWADFEVTFTTTTAALNTYTGGFLTWSDEWGHNVRIPMVVKPVALAAPMEVFGTGGSLSFDVTFGYTGNFDAAARGLIPATTFTDTIPDDPTDSFVPGGPGTKSYDIVVPAGTTYFRAALFDEFTDGADDLDLYVYRGTTLVGSSGSGTSAEEVNLINPAADTYTVWVHGWGTDGPDAVYTLFTWVLGTDDEGNMTVSAPSTAVIGEKGTINLTFSDLLSGTKYLGSIAYSDGFTPLPLNPTIVRIDTP